MPALSVAGLDSQATTHPPSTGRGAVVYDNHVPLPGATVRVLDGTVHDATGGLVPRAGGEVSRV